MDRREILATRFGEMLDMINCLSIYNGDAVPKKSSGAKHYTDFDAAIKLR